MPATPTINGHGRSLVAALFLPFILTLSSCATSPQRGARSALAAVHTLTAGQLTVKVMDPNAPDRYYRGQRFSPVAMVLGVRMGGHDFLFAPSRHDPLVDGGGLANEFDIGTESYPPPPGFDEAAAGEGFLKVGVGILRKEADPLYKFYVPYAVLRPAITTAEWHPDRADFHQTCAGVAGYAYRLDAEVVVAASKVRIAYRLSNTGTKPFSTEQYAHNFFSFDGRPVTPGAYLVEFPYDYTATILKPVIRRRGRQLELTGDITPKVKAAQAFVHPPAGLLGGDTAIVSQPATGLQVRATLSRSATQTTVHMGPLYLCPEQFLRVDLKPGGAVEWTRTYVFHVPTS